LLASNPDFIEVRLRMVQSPFRPDPDLSYVADLDEILKLDISLAERAAVLDSQIFWLNRAGRIDEDLPVIKRWNAVETELLKIYPPAAKGDVQASHNGLLGEAKKVFDDALVSYKVAAAILSRDSRFADNARFETDLGLARVHRQLGNAEEARRLCDNWSTRWKRLVSAPLHHPWELREDGPEELQGRWEFSCGSPAKGFKLIEDAAMKYPDSNAPYTALAQYYYSIGDIDKARDAEATASRLLQEWGRRLGNSDR
jgi:hypothetical protein